MNYTIVEKGLSLLFTGDSEEAEHYFQTSVRWAQSPLQHLQTMTNLGRSTTHLKNKLIYAFVHLYVNVFVFAFVRIISLEQISIGNQ